MTSTDRLLAGVIGALLAPSARLYETKAAFGAVIVCVAFAATMEVMITTTVARRMTPGRENFWIRIVIAFNLFDFLLCWFFLCWPRGLLLDRVQLPRFFGLSTAGASFFVFPVRGREGRAGQNSLFIQAQSEPDKSHLLYLI